MRDVDLPPAGLQYHDTSSRPTPTSRDEGHLVPIQPNDVQAPRSRSSDDSYLKRRMRSEPFLLKVIFLFLDEEMWKWRLEDQSSRGRGSSRWMNIATEDRREPEMM